MRPVKTRERKKSFRLSPRKRFCRMCQDNVAFVDYKDLKRLPKFMSDRGKIVSRRSSGNCARHQRMVVRAIKQARFAALLPYVK